MVKKVITCLWVIIFLIPTVSPASAHEEQPQTNDFLSRPEVQAFIKDLVSHQGFDEHGLTRMFAKVKRRNDVLEAISRPAETKPWHEYRAIFITSKRIAGGVQFWDSNEGILQRAEETYGVPAEIIVAIIGVESFYGRRTGIYPVLDTLTTLGFDYPPRAKFFRSELKHLLLLARDESLEISTAKGSYAGAMGQGQFIPSSYRHYAVDFDNDGKRDLWSSNADAIGSVANYFKRHGWQLGSQVALPANKRGTSYKKLLGRGMKPNIQPTALASHGVSPAYGRLGADEVAFFEFDTEQAKEHWIGFNNFYVITRYNISPLYALAVYQLSEEIKQAREHNKAKIRS